MGFLLNLKNKFNTCIHNCKKLDKIPEVKKQLIWDNYKHKDTVSNLSWCQNCGELINSIDSKITTYTREKEAICPYCHYDHDVLSEYPIILDKDSKKQCDNFWKLLTDGCTINYITINCNDFFAFACADSYDVEKVWFPLMLDLYNQFGIDGVYGLVCWLSGRLPMPEILKNDKVIIQVLLYLRRLTGVTFNPDTRNRFNKRILINKIKEGDFHSWDLDDGVKNNWITPEDRDKLLNIQKDYLNRLNDIGCALNFKHKFCFERAYQEAKDNNELDNDTLYLTS